VQHLELGLLDDDGFSGERKEDKKHEEKEYFHQSTTTGSAIC
jgi:hypothetical protein